MSPIVSGGLLGGRGAAPGEPHVPQQLANLMLVLGRYLDQLALRLVEVVPEHSHLTVAACRVERVDWGVSRFGRQRTGLLRIC